MRCQICFSSAAGQTLGALWEEPFQHTGLCGMCSPAAVLQPPLEDAEMSYGRWDGVQTATTCGKTGRSCISTMEKRQHYKSVPELQRWGVMELLACEFGHGLCDPQHSTLRICLSKDAQKISRAQIRCLAHLSKFNLIHQPRKVLNTKLLMFWHPRWVLGNGKAWGCTESEHMIGWMVQLCKEPKMALTLWMACCDNENWLWLFIDISCSLPWRMNANKWKDNLH